jgi:energy-coupling factor transporter transmembrane protein EcfT
MINFDILDEFNEIFKKPFTFYEISLNIFFIIIVGIISYVIYWSIINGNSIKYSRCKGNLKSLGSIADNYIVYTTDTNNNKLFNISYDTKTKTPTINCACPTGNYVNTFDKIKIYDEITQTSYLSKKNCMCDNDYSKSYDPANSYYSGEPFLIKYMNDFSDPTSLYSMPNIEDKKTNELQEAEKTLKEATETAAQITTKIAELTAIPIALRTTEQINKLNSLNDELLIAQNAVSTAQNKVQGIIANPPSIAAKSKPQFI